MYFKNRYFSFFIGVSALMIFGGCNKFLDQTDPSNYSEHAYYNNASEAEQAVNSIYASVYPIYNIQAWMITLVRTGIANTNFPDDAGYPNLTDPKKLGNFSRHRDLETLWDSYYQGIANANMAIKYIPSITMDETDKSKLMGQAYFLRAYYYFNLVRMFGELPLITEPIESIGSPELSPERSSVDSVYKQIASDLRNAESSKLPVVDNTGRVSMSAVKSLLSSVYLTMAGYPLQKGQEYYKLAMDEAEEVIQSHNFDLFDTYEFLKDPKQNNQGEYIFEIQFDQDHHPNNSLQFANVPYRAGISAYSSEEGFVFVVDQFVQSFENKDKRVNAFFYDKYTSNVDRSDTVHFANTYIYKFFNKEAIENTAKSGLNWSVIRYPEVLLNYAEASNEVNGPTKTAYSAINEVRERAGISDLSGLSQPQFRKKIWMERYHELCFENKVWFDMARTRKAFNFSTGNFEDYVGHTFTYGVTLENPDLLFPLPQDELRNNPNIHQNPGFE